MNSPSRTRIKFCGITRLEDALTAINVGADALGFVFYAPSPRHIDIQQAADIMQSLPPFVTKVGLFVNAESSLVEQVLQSTSVNLLQFHGDESASDCEQYGMPYMKALRMRDDIDLQREFTHYASACAILLDSYRAGTPGGTGETFSWDRIPEKAEKPIVLAGGLRPDNVADAVKSVRPYAVDVSGGIEVSKGIKDAEKMRQFVTEVKRID